MAIHGAMLADARRNQALAQSLVAAVRPGDVVIDLGAGSGLLAMVAARQGARKVYAIERSSMAALARRLVAQNGYQDVIEVVQADSFDWQLPERAQVLISETLGFAVFDEQFRACVADARDRMLVAGGRIIPERIDVHAAPVSPAAGIVDIGQMDELLGFDFSPLARLCRGAHQRGYKISVKLETIAHQMPGSKVEHNPDYVIPPQSEELADAYLQMTLQCEARGIQVSRDTAHTTPCMFSSNHGVIFGPDGTIYKCISLVGRAEFGVGTVFDDEYDRVEYDKQMNTHKRLDECFSEACPYVPVCAGGCAYESVVRTGNYNTRFCTRPFLQKFHYLRCLIQHEDKLKALGMRPVTAQELAASEVEVQPPRPRLPVLQTAATSGCGTCG